MRPVVVAILLCCWLSFGHGFSLLTTTTPEATHTSGRSYRQPQQLLAMATVNTRSPTQEEAEEMGIREWPQQAKQQGSFQEVCQDDDKSLVRYVLDGSGSVTITSLEDEDNDQEQKVAVAPGSLVEVTGTARLTWQVDSKEMILLTPGFEQLGLFAAVAVGLVVIVAGLLALS